MTTSTFADPAHPTCIPANNFKLCTLKTQKGTNPLYQDFTYTFTADGNVDLISDPINGNQDFGYDALDRLTSATGPYGTGGATTTFTYTYNQIGNMLSNPQVGTYTYPTSGAGVVRPHAATMVGTYPLTYDNNGNMLTLTDPAGFYGYNATYNVDNRLSSVVTTYNAIPTTTTFVYDGDGGRVKKIVGTTTTRYISKLYECDTTGANTSCSRFIWAGDTRIATVAVTSGVVHYWHGDHLGSSSVITDSTGAKVQALTYYPYGDIRTNQSFTNPAIDVPYKYTGKELDTSSNLYFYESRYYHAVFGRFIPPDTIVPNPRDPQDLNRYTYAGNNPLKYTDPSGHIKIGKFFKRLFHKFDRFVQNNAWFRALSWAVLPGVTMNLDFGTRNQVWAAGAGIATGGLVGGPLGWGGFAGAVSGGAASGAVNAGLSDSNVLRGTGMGALAGAVGYGAGFVGGGLVNPDAGSYAAQIGKGAFVGALKGATISLATNLSEGRIDSMGLLRSAAIGAAVGAVRPLAIGRDVTDLPSRSQNIDFWQQRYGADFSGVSVKEGGLLNAGLQLTGHDGITLGGMINLETGGGVLRGLMGHELWHVVQAQERGLVLFQAGYLFNSQHYEMEADRMSGTHYGVQGIP